MRGKHGASVGLLLTALTLLLTACAKDKYAEVKKILTDNIQMYEELNKSLDAATNGKQAAEALRAFIGKMKTLGPRAESLPEQYPELEREPPAELKTLLASFERLTTEFDVVFEKLVKFGNDPDVTSALSEFETME